jgi:hypothetical protein
MNTKAAYVRSQGQTRDHHCHWPGCEKPVPPAMWGCRGHWFALPAKLRAKVWATFRPGQEVNGTPSEAYMKVANEVQAWIRVREKDEHAARASADEKGQN